MAKEAVMHRETGEVSVMHCCFIYSAGDKRLLRNKISGRESGSAAGWGKQLKRKRFTKLYSVREENL